MTAPHQAALRALSYEFQAMSAQLTRVAGQLGELERALNPLIAPPVPAPPPVPQWSPVPGWGSPVAPQYPVVPPYPVWPDPVRASQPPPGPSRAGFGTERGTGWIGTLLAVAGVAVTLIGVVLLLVLAAQAGILRPEIRVGAGAALAVALVYAGCRLKRRPGGRVGAIALAATGIGAAYIDVLAVTAIYHWIVPVGGLLLAGLIGGGGLALARRWDSQQLGLLVLVPLMVLGPIVTDGVTLLLIGFMIVLSAAVLPVQIGKDWIWLHAARTAAPTVPLMLALVMVSFSGALSGTARANTWLLGGACAVAALLAVLGALVLLPHSSHRPAMALVTVGGVLPALMMGIAVEPAPSALVSAVISAGMLAIITAARMLPGVDRVVTVVWSALSAVAALIAVTVAFDGPVAVPVLLGLAAITGYAGRSATVWRCVAVGFAFFGGLGYLGYAPPDTLWHAVALSTPIAVSTLVSSVLVILGALVIAWSWTVGRRWTDSIGVVWVGAGVTALYGLTMFAVTAGVLIAGVGGGFLTGHMVATICWVVAAAGLFVIAHRTDDRNVRTAATGAGLTLTAGAMAKLFLFDLGTLDGMFRVGAFMVVGLVLLAMGAGYARSLSSKGMPNQS